MHPAHTHSAMIELPDLRQVRSLVAVAETESFTRASEQLRVTQSAVSHSIRALETHLSCKLVERSGKRVALTQHGVVLFRRFKSVLSELEHASEDLGVLNRWGQGRLRVGATHTLCTFLLPKVMRELRELYPRCEVHIESGDTSELISHLDGRVIDLALGIEGRTPGWARFEQIFEDEMVFIMAPNHPWASLECISTTEIERESFLVYARASETYRLLKESFETQGSKLRPSLSLGDMSAIKEMVKVGMGVGIVAPWTVTEDVKNGDLVVKPLGHVSHRRSWGLLCYEGRQLSMVEADFLRICRKVCKGLTGAAN